jgi:hypothetical protein
VPYIEPGFRTIRADYDFAVDGGTVGTKTLRGGKVPGGALITDAVVVIDTALAGGTVTDTLALQAEAAGDIQTATARNAAPWSTTGGKRHSGGASTAAPPLTTQERQISFVVAGTALTGGKFRVFIRYIEPTS